MLAGDFNVEPTKIPCLLKDISDGLWVGRVLALNLMLPASGIGLVFGGLGGTLFSGVLWRLLPWKGAGWISVAGSSLVSRFVLPLWLLVGLLRSVSL